MKRYFWICAVLVSSTMIYSGCKKPDNTHPVIALKGNNPYTVTLNSPFTDPGYTALDNKDGDITSKVTTSWSPAFNQNLTGTYILTYTVGDAAGNPDTARRTVYVVNSAGFLSGEYLNVNGSCGITGPLTFNSSVVSSSTINNNFTIGNFGGFNTTLNAIYYPDRDSVSVPAGQSLGGTK